MEQRDMKTNQPHALLLPYPGQGHINPMLQFGKRLVSTHNLRASIAITRFMSKCTQPQPGPVSIETISDGFDDNGFAEIGDVPAYLDRLSSAGSKSLSDLISSLRSNGRPVQVLIYDGFLTWAVDVAKRFGLASAAFFTQSCAVDALYWHAYDGRLKIPAAEPVESLPGLPRLEPRDLPSLMTDAEPAPYPAYLALLKNQYINLDEADVVLINSFYELERKDGEISAEQLELAIRSSSSS